MRTLTFHNFRILRPGYAHRPGRRLLPLQSDLVRAGPASTILPPSSPTCYSSPILPKRPRATHPMQQELKNVRWNHEELIDHMLANPGQHQREIAKVFDRTETWISIIVNSDAFKARLAERKEELVDPILKATLNDRICAAANKSMELVLEKLNSPLPPKDDFIMEAAKLSLGALGYGARGAGQSNDGAPSVQVIVNVPGKAESREEWSARWGRGPTPPSDLPFVEKA